LPGQTRPAAEGRPAEPGLAVEGCPAEPGPAAEGRPDEYGLALEGRPVEPGPALEARRRERGLAPEGRLAEPGLPLERRRRERGLALEDHPAERGVVLEGRLVELRGVEGVAMVLVWRGVKDALEQFGAEPNATGIDGALLADALEFGLEGGRVLLGRVRQAAGRCNKTDATATVAAAGLPRHRLVASHAPPLLAAARLRDPASVLADPRTHGAGAASTSSTEGPPGQLPAGLEPRFGTTLGRTEMLFPNRPTLRRGYWTRAPPTLRRHRLADRTGHDHAARPIAELAAALRTLADALDHEQATSTVTYTATVEPHARGPAPGGMTTVLADRFVGQLTPAAVDVVELLCRNAPELTYEALQAEVQARLGISRDQLGGC
jgi:hypothetical protein